MSLVIGYWVRWHFVIDRVMIFPTLRVAVIMINS